MSLHLSVSKYVNRTTKFHSNNYPVLSNQHKQSSTRFTSPSQNPLTLSLYLSDSKEVHNINQLVRSESTMLSHHLIPSIKDIDKYWKENMPEEVKHKPTLQVETQDSKSVLAGTPPNLKHLAVQRVSPLPSEENPWLLEIPSDVSQISGLTDDPFFNPQSNNGIATKQEPPIKSKSVGGTKEVKTKEPRSVLVGTPPNLKHLAVQRVSSFPSEGNPWLLEIPSDASQISGLTDDPFFHSQSYTKIVTKQEPPIKSKSVREAKDGKYANKKLNNINTTSRNEQVSTSYDMGQCLKRYQATNLPQPRVCQSARSPHLPQLKRCQSENLTSQPAHLSQLKRCQSENLTPQSQRKRCQSDPAAYLLPGISPSKKQSQRHSAFASLREILSDEVFEDLQCKSQKGLVQHSTSSTAQSSSCDNCEDAGSFSRLLVQNRNKGYIEGRVKVEDLTCHHLKSRSSSRKSRFSLIGSGTSKLKREINFIVGKVTFRRPKLVRSDCGYLA